jgi:hypothetical protein
LLDGRAGPLMHKRHTLHGAAHRIGVRGRSLSSQPPGESGTRIRGAQQQPPAGVDENVLASIDSAMHELDSLEMPFRASAPPLTAPPPPQQMPRGMPPLPFQAPHPRHMPPLPVQRPALSKRPANDALLESERAVVEAPPSRWWLFVALTLGVACLALALWLQLH